MMSMQGMMGQSPMNMGNMFNQNSMNSQQNYAQGFKQNFDMDSMNQSKILLFIWAKSIVSSSSSNNMQGLQSQMESMKMGLKTPRTPSMQTNNSTPSSVDMNNFIVPNSQPIPHGGNPEQVLSQTPSEFQIEQSSFRSSEPSDWERLAAQKDLEYQKECIITFKSDFEKLQEGFKLQMLGDLVYASLNGHDLDPQEQRKITGMIVDFDVLSLDEILELLTNEDVLQDRIQEALELIREPEEEDQEEEEEEEHH